MNPTQKDVHELAHNKGFYELREKLRLHLRDTHAPTEMIDFMDRLWLAARLALIHAEVSEALETVARDQPEAWPKELADIQLRLMDLAESTHVDLNAAVESKHVHNQGRTLRHGGKKL